MVPQITTDSSVRVRSSIPGRERWEVDALRGRPHLTALVERILNESTEVFTSQANAVSGRLLITFSPATQPQRIRELILRAVNGAMALYDEEDRRAPSPRSRPSKAAKVAMAAGGIAVTTGVAVAVPALLLGTSITLPAVIGAGVVAALFAAVEAWRRRRKAVPSTPMHPAVRLWQYARPHRRLIFAASACSILKKVFDLAPPILVGLALDAISRGGNSLIASIGIVSSASQIWALAGLSVVVFTLESLFEFGYKLLWRNVAQTIQHELRMDVYSHVQDARMASLEDERTGYLATTLNDNINQLEIFLSESVNALLELATNVVVVMLVFAFILPGIGWIALVPIPILLWGSFAYQRRVAPIYAEVQERSGELAGQLVDNLGGIATIKSFTAEEHENLRIRGLSEEYLKSNRKANMLYSIFEPSTRFPILAGFSVVLLTGGMLALAGGLTAGKYALLLFLIQRFLFPFGFFGQTVNNYQKAMASIQEVFDLLDLPVGPDDGDTSLILSDVRGEIVFDRVEFSYGGAPVLRAFSVQIPAGQTIGIVGATGAGKTTLVKLLLRFYDIDGGRILIDGLDIRDLRVRDLRKAIGLVGQDGFLFDGTVRDNIAYGAPASSLDAIVEAAKLAEAHSFIEELPEGYETQVGERGAKLSGGQRQRLCIARAILKDPPILVLDEATSAVDNETEEAIQRSLRHISVGRTTVIIAHRLSTIRHASCIYVMTGRGEIIELGRHEDLIARNGFYAALWRVQTGTTDGGPN